MKVIMFLYFITSCNFPGQVHFRQETVNKFYHVIFNRKGTACPSVTYAFSLTHTHPQPIFTLNVLFTHIHAHKMQLQTFHCELPSANKNVSLSDKRRNICHDNPLL